MSYAVVMRLLTMLIVWLTLLVWVFNANRAGCIASAAVLALMTGMIFITGSERSHLLRRALLAEASQGGGRLLAVVHSHLPVLLRDTVSAALLAVVLLASALTFEPRQWSILLADLLLLTLLIPRLSRIMRGEVRSEYRYALARQWAAWISVLLLWSEAVLSLVFYPPADYIGMRWQELVTYNLSMPDAGCPLVQTAAQIFVTCQAIAIWALQNTSRFAHDPTQSIMLWVGYAALAGFTFLTALAYSRALIGVMGRPWEMWRGFRATTDDD